MSSDGEENPFVQALHSDALNDLLHDSASGRNEMAEKLAENLKKLSDMFVKLSDSEKHQFAKEFKGQFINQLKGLSDMIKQEKIVLQNAEDQKSIPVFGANDAFQGQIDFYIMIAIGGLVVLFVVFFGYKLYLSLTEQERKREEKQKAKQAKKKK